MSLTLRVTTEDVEELVRDLDAIEVGLGRALVHAIEDELDPILASLIAHTPVGPGPRVGADPRSDDALAHMNATYQTRVDRFGARIVSAHPGILVTNYGGEIAPRGTAIRIARHAMAEQALDEHEEDLAQRAQDAIDALLRRAIRT